MAWIFVLTLGENRPLWQLLLGSGLSILLVMTRQNMAVVPALLVAYIFWQYGGRAGWLALTTSAVLFIGFHIWYWPGILQIWAPWLPRSLTPFLDDFRFSAQLSQTDFTFNASSFSRWQSFATGVHDHFFVFCGSVSALILWPTREAWKSTSHFKAAVFLAVTFFSLFLMHTLVSLPTDYCVHCFSAYQMFYTTAGFFLILLVFSNGLNSSKQRLPLLMVSWLFFAANLGLYYYQGWGDWLLNNIQMPRLNRIFRQGDFSTISLRDVLTYTLDLAPELQKRIAPAAGGILLGLILIIFAWVLHRFFLQKEWIGKFSLVNTVLACCLFVGTVFPVIVTDRPGEEKCSTNFLSYYEKAGRSLSDLVPSGSLVYWRGSGRHLAFMLYMGQIKVFPPQIHAGGGYAVGDTEQLLRFGLFNDELDHQWRESADILIVWETYLTDEFRAFLDQSSYEQIPFDMGKLAQCEDALYVFRRAS